LSYPFLKKTLVNSLLIQITAGNDPAQGSAVWLDRYFGMGEFTKDLIPQYDCPPESVYLPATTFSILGNVQRQRAICIFEQDVGKPLSRHYGYQEGETGASSHMF
jgi:primary-amine oxidase